MNKRNIYTGILGMFIFLGFQSCSPASGESPGHEYMPDMGHAITYEPNRIDEYSLHTWNDQSVRTVNQLWGTPRNPVHGSIARGSVGMVAHGNSDEYVSSLRGVGNRGISTPINGNVPYYYADNDAERIRATKEIVMNPFPITKKGLEKGKELWKIYCGICHGDKCEGNGYLVRDDGKYPAQPANLVLDTFVNGNNGRLYHAIMYGKNVMGNYADKLSYEERWQVIHYIRACQASGKQLQYDENWNTFKPTAAISDSLSKTLSASKKVVPTAAPVKKAVMPVTPPMDGGGGTDSHSKRR
jgi:mono/diheme cytochrome c family protein